MRFCEQGKYNATVVRSHCCTRWRLKVLSVGSLPQKLSWSASTSLRPTLHACAMGLKARSRDQLTDHPPHSAHAARGLRVHVIARQLVYDMHAYVKSSNTLSVKYRLVFPRRWNRQRDVLQTRHIHSFIQSQIGFYRKLSLARSTRM